MCSDTEYAISDAWSQRAVLLCVWRLLKLCEIYSQNLCVYTVFGKVLYSFEHCVFRGFRNCQLAMSVKILCCLELKLDWVFLLQFLAVFRTGSFWTSQQNAPKNKDFCHRCSCQLQNRYQILCLQSMQFMNATLCTPLRCCQALPKLCWPPRMFRCRHNLWQDYYIPLDDLIQLTSWASPLHAVCAVQEFYQA